MNPNSTPTVVWGSRLAGKNTFTTRVRLGPRGVDSRSYESPTKVLHRSGVDFQDGFCAVDRLLHAPRLPSA